MDQRLAQALRARGVDVQTALDADMVERADEDHLAHAAERAYADQFIRDLPNGYQTVVGDRGVRLSGCSALSEAKK